MKNKVILLSPHMDDESLFASYIIAKSKPLTVVVLYNGDQHQRRFNIHNNTRKNETIKACGILGVPVEFYDLSDEEYDSQKVFEVLRNIRSDVVYAPAKEGGNRHHDIVAEQADIVFGDKVIHYSTYTKDRLYPQGKTPVTGDEQLKEKVLDCYKSQHDINQPHFEAVKGVPEWLL